jgi:hypothetical protein
MKRYMRLGPDEDITLRIMELAKMAQDGVRILAKDLRRKKNE